MTKFSSRENTVQWLQWLLFIISISAMSSPLCFAHDTSPFPNDIKTIQERGFLRIGILEVMAPPFVFEKDGTLTGHDVDICRDMADALGVEPQFIRIPGSYDDVVNAVEKGEVDIGMTEISKTASRSQRIFYSKVYFTSDIILIANRLSLAQSPLKPETIENDVRTRVLPFFNKPHYTIATMGGTSFIPMTAKIFPNAEVLPLESWEEAAFAVYRGSADLAVLPGPAYRLNVRKNTELLYKLKELNWRIDDPLAIAVWPGYPDLVRWINDYLETNVLGQTTGPQELVEKYFKTGSQQEGEVEEVDLKLELTQSLKGSNLAVTAGLHILLLSLFWWFVIRNNRKEHWLLSPWAVLIGMLLGGVMGANFPALAHFFSKPGNIYMGFWRMCVLPIMFSAIVTSVYRLLTRGDNTSLVKRLLVATPLILFLASLVGIGLGIIGKPGTDFSKEAQKLLVLNLDENIQTAKPLEVYEQIMAMAEMIVPDNIFVPLMENQSLAVLFIAAFFGIAVAGGRRNKNKVVVDFLETILEAFTKMIHISLYLLPFALYSLTMDFMANTGTGLLVALLRLVVLLTIALLPPLLLSIFTLYKRLEIPVSKIIEDFGPVFLLSFSARSSVITMPLGLELLGNYPKINKNQSVAAFPFALLICHYPKALFYTMVPIFIGQAFGIEFTLIQYMVILLMSALATLAAIGGIGTHVFLLPIVCTPLGLPLDPAILIGLAISSVLTPLFAAVQAIIGCGVTTLLVEKTGEPWKEGSAEKR